MNQKGSRQNPYWSDEFTNLYNQNRWTGGWVLSANGGSKDYYRSNAVPLHAYENGILGSLNKPFPGEIYNEMIFNGTWTGGWVRIEIGDVTSAEYRTEDQISFSKENSDGIQLGYQGNPVYRKGHLEGQGDVAGVHYQSPPLFATLHLYVGSGGDRFGIARGGAPYGSFGQSSSRKRKGCQER